MDFFQQQLNELKKERREIYMTSFKNFKKAGFDISLIKADTGEELEHCRNNFDEILNALEEVSEEYGDFDMSAGVPCINIEAPENYYCVMLELPFLLKFKFDTFGWSNNYKRDTKIDDINVFCFKMPACPNIAEKRAEFTKRFPHLNTIIGTPIRVSIKGGYHNLFKVKMEDMAELTEETLLILDNLEKRVAEFHETTGEYFELLKELPSPTKYKISKRLMKNLPTINLSIKQKRVLEVLHLLINNSNFIYTEQEKGFKFLFSKKDFKRFLRKEWRISKGNIETILTQFHEEEFPFRYSPKGQVKGKGMLNIEIERKIHLIDNLEFDDDTIKFELNPLLIDDIVATKGKGFFVEQEFSVYDKEEFHNVYDYLRYRIATQMHKSQPINVDTLLKNMGFPVNYSKNQKSRIYKNVNSILEFYFNEGLIQSHEHLKIGKSQILIEFYPVQPVKKEGKK